MTSIVDIIKASAIRRLPLNEAIRLLQSLIEQLTKKPDPIKAGDVFILRDINGNRVGVMDVIGD